jgi:hypothetical protein
VLTKYRPAAEAASAPLQTYPPLPHFAHALAIKRKETSAAAKNAPSFAPIDESAFFYSIQ